MNVLFLFLFVIIHYLKPSKCWILPTIVTTNPHYHKHLGIITLFAKKKSPRIRVTLECSEARKLGLPPSRYYTSRNRAKNSKRLQLMKYNKFLRRHTLHKEI